MELVTRQIEINAVAKAYRHMDNPAVRSVAVYVSKVRRVKLTRRFKAKYLDGDMVLTVGRPNVRESAFVRDCIEAGERFPVRKAQLSFFKQEAK